MAAAIVVVLDQKKHDARPAHHANDTKTLFQNPWPSFKQNGFLDFARMRLIDWKAAPLPPKEELLPVVRPNWGKEGDLSTYDSEIKATWLGHACFLLEFPSAQPGQRGLRVLLDPVFEKRCSPSQLVGPARYTDPPIQLSELPEIDAVLTSHAHYDHLSVTSTRTIYKKQSKGSVHFFAGLGNKAWYQSVGLSADHCHQLDWWDSATMVNDAGPSQYLRFTCTPCQHFANRSPFDMNQTLWCSWAIELVQKEVDGTERITAKVFFGGDSGYATRPKGYSHLNDGGLPYCPAFKEIGERFGGFDLALLPIGAYSPNHFMSPIHQDPYQAVKMHQDIKSKRSLGMHACCWMLTDEPPMEPIEKLAEATKLKGLPDSEFTVLSAIGATLRVKPE